MELKQEFVLLLVIGFVSKYAVEGLQCYVCEDCNEYEDFKELHICGEIPVVGTVRPLILPGATDSEEANEDELQPSKKPTAKPSKKPTLKPDLLENSSDYLYSDEGSVEKPIQKTTPKPTSTLSKTTPKPISTLSETTPKPISTLSKTTTKPTATTRKPTTEQKKTTTQSSIKSTTKAKPSSGTATNTVKPKPVVTDYDDYLEYEDPEARSEIASKSLLKISEPVCYMIKYQVNNTVITNRGCTTFINSNKYLTCQTLYNGAPMESCRICSSNGCNKFLSTDGDSEEDYHGIPNNATKSLEKLAFYVLILSIVLNSYVF